VDLHPEARLHEAGPGPEKGSGPFRISNHHHLITVILNMKLGLGSTMRNLDDRQVFFKSIVNEPVDQILTNLQRASSSIYVPEFLLNHRGNRHNNPS
jgi:hypothetical protein